MTKPDNDWAHFGEHLQHDNTNPKLLEMTTISTYSYRPMAPNNKRKDKD